MVVYAHVRPSGVIRTGCMRPLGGTLLFVVSYWHEVRIPFLLFVAAGVVHTVVVVQAGRTLAKQAKQAPAEQGR